MDSLITAAARALAAGDPLGALQRVALRDDAPALALRGTAMAQLGDFERAKALLRCAAKGFGRKEPMAQARCVVAEAEVALASRDLAWSAASLVAARKILATRGDRVNAAHARIIEIRRWLTIGHLDDAERALEDWPGASSLPPALQAMHGLAIAGIAMRRVRAGTARVAMARAAAAARRAGIPALVAEVEHAASSLDGVVARSIQRGRQRRLVLDEVETLLRSNALVVDACRHMACQAGKPVSLVTRPILFTLLRTLAEAWPTDVSRDALVAQAFRLKRADESLRARLRVEVGRLRKALRPLADVRATPGGFVLSPRNASEVVVLANVVEEKHPAVLALLADGEAWSSSGLALALGVSQRNIQRALESLVAAGKIRSTGRGRACRWLVPTPPEFTPVLLLPAPLPDS